MNNKVVKNAGYMYFRMAFILFISLYTSRVVLKALGVSDFGIFNVVGGVVVLTSFIANTLRDSLQRFYSFSLGAGNIDDLNRLYSTSVILHIFVAFLFLITSSLGYWFIPKFLLIPENRLNIALWVYFYSVLGMCVSIISIPSAALVLSYEYFKLISFLGIFEGVFKLLIAFAIGNYAGDKLYLYSVLSFCLSFIVSLYYILFVKFKMKKVKFVLNFDRMTICKLCSFSGWNILGAFSNLFVSNGTNIILNMFFPPDINAARGLSYQVMGAVRQFSSNFQSVINPQIIKNYAACKLREFWYLVFVGSRVSFLLFLFICAPLTFYIENILFIWLGEFPTYTPIFVILVLVNALFESLTYPITTAVRAIGNIKKYQLVTSLLLCIGVVISYFVLDSGGKPYSVFIVNILFTVIVLVVRLYLIYQLSHFPLTLLKVMIYRILCSFLSIGVVDFIIKNTIISLWLGLFMICVINVVLIWFVGINNMERNYLQLLLMKILRLNKN